MALVKSTDENITTLIADIPGVGPTVIYVYKPIEDVKEELRSTGWTSGDSAIGEVHVTGDSVKAAQIGQREINPSSVQNRA